MLDKAVDENGVGSTGSTKKNSKRGANKKEKIADKERLLSSYYLVSHVHLCVLIPEPSILIIAPSYIFLIMQIIHMM